MVKSREEIAGKAVGEELLDMINTRWYEYSEEGMILEDAFKQTIIDVISGQYFG